MPISAFASASGSGAWQDAWSRSSGSYLLGVDFVGSLVNAFASGNERLAVYEGPSGIEAATVVAPFRASVWTTFHPTEACLGIWLRSPDVDSEKLALALLSRLPRFPMILGVRNQDPRLNQRPADAGSVRTVDNYKTAWVPIEGKFDDYWSARGKNLRNNMKRARTQIERAGIVARLDVLTRSADVAPSLAEYEALEAGGWKGKAGSAVRSGNQQGHFYREILERACDRELGRIYRYLLNDEVVAMDLCVMDGNRLVILKTAYDEKHGSLSPASLMREEQIRRLFAAGDVGQVEFYGPLMEWHTRWTSCVTTMYHVNYYRHPLLPRLQRALRIGTATAEAPAAGSG